MSRSPPDPHADSTPHPDGGPAATRPSASAACGPACHHGAPGVAHGAADARMHLFWQMLDDIASLMLLTALDQRRSTEGLDDRLAQRLAAVDHPQAHALCVQPAIDQIR